MVNLNFIRFGFRKNLFNCAKINSKSEEIGNRTFTGYWRWLRGNSLWLGHYDITPIEINHLKEKSRTVWRVLDLRIIIIKKRKMIWYIVLILFLVQIGRFRSFLVKITLLSRVFFLTVDFKTVHFRTKLSKFTISQENHAKILIWVTYRILNN